MGKKKKLIGTVTVNDDTIPKTLTIEDTNSSSTKLSPLMLHTFQALQDYSKNSVAYTKSLKEQFLDISDVPDVSYNELGKSTKDLIAWWNPTTVTAPPHITIEYSPTPYSQTSSEAEEQGYIKAYTEGYNDGKHNAIKHGHWESDSVSRAYSCSICQNKVLFDSNFCPFCGADMRGIKTDD